MNIEDLTIKQARELASMFGGAPAALTATSATSAPAHPFVGKYCIFRCYGAGVHAGELISSDGTNAIVKNSRRLWQWRAKKGVALSGVAMTGLSNPEKIDVELPDLALTDVIEIIPCTKAAEDSIRAA